MKYSSLILQKAFDVELRSSHEYNTWRNDTIETKTKLIELYKQSRLLPKLKLGTPAIKEFCARVFLCF